MKKRIFAAAAALPILLAMVVTTPHARAAASYESLVDVVGYSVSRADMSAKGSIADFTITVSFPQLSAESGNNGIHANGSLTARQLQELDVSIGPNSDFDFANGDKNVEPFASRDFTSYISDATARTATFNVSLIYNGGQGILELVLSHPTKLDNQGATADATTTKPLYISETVYQSSPESPGYSDVPDVPDSPGTPSYPNPDATPNLTITGHLPNLEAGKRGTIRFALSNNSRYSAYRVFVTISGGSEEILRPTAITVDTISVGTIYTGASNTKNVEIPVEVLDDVKEGYYTIALLLTMENGAGVAITQNSNIQIFVKNPRSGQSAGTPSLNMSSATIDNNVPPSDGVIELELAIANIGDGTATDARISLTGFKSSEITLNESLVTKSLGDIASGGNAAVTYSLKAAKELESGSYPLNVEVKYKLPDGTEGIMSDIAYINIMRPPDTNSNLQLVGISQDISNPGTANIIRVTLTVQNKGDTAAEDVSISLGGLSSSSFTLSGDFGDRKLGAIDPDGTAETTVALYVSESLSTGNYPLSVSIRYSDPGAPGAQAGLSETEVYVFVNRPERKDPIEDEPDTSVPRVIISRHSISVDNVVAGAPFELSVTLLNTSMNKNIKNLKVTVTDKDGIFIPVEGVNSFYIEGIPIGQTNDIAITLAPKQDAETKSYPISISLDYEDEKNTAYSVTESLSIPVYLPQRLEVSNVNFYDEGTGMAYLSFQFINKGKAPLYNMNIRIEGPMNAMEGDYYIGTFGPGQADYFEDSIILQMYGEVAGDVVLEFEDSSGAQQELRYPISAYVNEPFMPDPGFPGGEMWPGDPGFPFEDGFVEEGGGLKSWAIWTIVGGVVIIGGVLTIVIIKKKKHKKDELADDE